MTPTSVLPPAQEEAVHGSLSRRSLVQLAVVAMIAALLIPGQVMADDISVSKGFRKAVTLAGVRAHQQALQTIASANGSTRASGTPGYEASVDYVVERLEDAGYDPVVQPFQFPFFRETSPSEFERVAPGPRTYVNGTDFATMTYSGSGNVTAPATFVDTDATPNSGAGPGATTSGCDASDFAGFPSGNIAIMQRGTCTFFVKAQNAQAAGASAAVVFNRGTAGETGAVAGTLGTPGINIPTIGASFAVATENYPLRNAGLTMRVETATESDIRTTWNVIAETASGDSENVVVAGAHLDSVIAGPGINDNGSGSATILEIAEVFAAQDREARNKLRFMWFGAEELNLLGSAHYVANLTPDERADIMAMLNFDMVGSPNYVRFVYDGDGSHTSPAGPAGSAFIEQVFVDYFDSQGLQSEPTQFSGRSDYGPFIARGIPAGGLFTGAEAAKTPAQQAIYGGTAGIAYDPCYHQACDTFANNSNTGLDQMSDAAAHAILTMSRTKVDITVTEAASALRSAGGTVQPDFLAHPDDLDQLPDR